MTNPSNTPASLVDIVNTYVLRLPDETDAQFSDRQMDALTAFEEVANRVIGEDDHQWIQATPSQHVATESCNRLRAAQRQALQKKIGR